MEQNDYETETESIVKLAMCEFDNFDALFLSETFDIHDITEKVAEKLLTILEKLTSALKGCSPRYTVPENSYRNLLDLLVACLNAILDNGERVDQSSVSLASECLRCVRNACALSPDNQDRFIRHDSTLQCVVTFISSFLTSTKSDCSHPDYINSLLPLVRLSVQCLGNAAVGNKVCQSEIWQKTSSLLGALLYHGDEKLCTYTCMLVHTCMGSVEGVHQSVEGAQVISGVLQHLSTHDTQWGRLVCEVGLSQVRQDFETSSVASDNLLYLADVFCDQAPIILDLGQESSDPVEGVSVVTALLDVMCAATAQHTLHSTLCDHQPLLQAAVDLLHCVNALGQKGSNIFTPASKLSACVSQDASSPVFGLKRDLVRLLSNLSYNHKVNQDKIRELGGIPLILDNTNIDETNPYVSQWSVLAIRNLCANNLANQEVINSMKLQGLDDNVTMLRDIGVEAELKDDRIVIKNVKKK